MGGRVNTDEISDRLAIAERINRYCDAISRNDWDAHQECFTADAVWEVSAPFNLRLEGAANIRSGTQAAIGGHDFVV
jgi:ketosteroid isomerase-like protein